MTQAFRLPYLGEGIHEAEILDVCVSAGQAVHEGESVLQVETDKAVVEIPSPYTGTVAEIKVNKGDVVRVGEVLLTFTTGEVGKEPQRQPAEAVQSAQQPRREGAVAQTNGHPAGHPVPASPATRRLAMELGVDLHAVPG